MLQMSMSKLSLKVLLGVFALMFSARVGLSAECKDDPNECTPKNLCEIATQFINDNKVWSEDDSAANHIAFVKELGMECGIVEIKDPCDLDPSECKVKQLCEKATTVDNGSKSWSAEAEAYVELAKDYGLDCGVRMPTEVDNAVGQKAFEKKHYYQINKKQRKQIQYALEYLGFYEDRIDGLWGSGTRIAINKFIQSRNISENYPYSVYRKLISMVDVPTFTSAPKVSSSEKLTNLRFNCQRLTFTSSGFASVSSAKSWFPSKIWIVIPATKKWMASNYGIDKSRSANERKFNTANFQRGTVTVHIRGDELSRSSKSKVYVQLRSAGYKNTNPAVYECSRGTATNWQPEMD